MSQVRNKATNVGPRGNAEFSTDADCAQNKASQFEAQSDLRVPSMSQAALEDIIMTDAGDDRQYAPLSAQNQKRQRGFDFVDSSGPIFSMYMELAEEEDKKMAESWKADAEGILVFTGLFSAAVATLISVSIQDLRQNPQDTSNFYLAGIYQSALDPNRSDVSSSLPASPPPFSPPTYAIWVNSLWFLSLVISITCALLATLLQQWARRYLKVTQPRSSLHKRARIRSFFAEGVEKSHLAWVVEALPTLIHLSLFLFFAGLIVFSRNVNFTIFKVVLSWIGVCTALYGFITIVPLFRRDSPCYSPLTPLAKPIVFMILFVLLILYYFCFHLFLMCFSACFSCCGSIRAISGHLMAWLFEILRTTFLTPAKAALNSSSEIDTRAVMWTFDCLDEDHELERFFSGLPGFHSSKVLKEPLHSLNYRQRLRLLEAMIRLRDRTFSSNTLSDEVRRRRADICDNAMKLVDTPNAFPTILCWLAYEDEYGPLQSTKIADFVRCWGSGKGELSPLGQTIFSIVVARVQQRDDSWFILASDQLGIPETVLRSHATHGDNLSLAILIYITRKQFTHFVDSSWPLDAISGILSAASKFNVQDTSPDLQHEFCALWNQILRRTQTYKFRRFSNFSDFRKALKVSEVQRIVTRILMPIRHVYIHLHEGTNSAPTYFSASTSEDHEILLDLDSYPMCNVTGHRDSFLTFLLSDSHDNPSLAPASLASLATPSFPLPAPSHVDDIATALLHDNSRPTRQTTQNFRVPVTSPDPASAGAMQDPVLKKQKSKFQKRFVVTHAPQPASEASAIRHPPSASVPSVDVFRPNVVPLTPPVPQTLPTPASTAPALDNTLLIATARDPPSATRVMTTNIGTTLDPQAPPPLVIDSDEAIPGSSVRELYNGQTGGPSSFTSPV